jgi:1,4-dihydroxy-2-naphthoate octaprenyltransferase
VSSAEKFLASALVLLFVFCAVQLYFWIGTTSALQDYQRGSCERGNVFVTQQWRNFLGDAEDAQRGSDVYNRKMAQAHALVVQAQLSGAGNPHRPTLRCSEVTG